MQDTENRTEQQERTDRALARQEQGLQRAYSVDLDDVPIYASTGTKRIPLGKSGKYWIEIQEELDFGQQTKLDNASVIGVMREQASTGDDASQTVRLDLERQRYLLCATWLVRWNVPSDKNQKTVALPRHVNDRINAIKHLHPRWGDAIVAAITEHVAALQELEEVAQENADRAAGIDPEDRDDQEGDELDPPVLSLNGESGVGVSSRTS